MNADAYAIASTLTRRVIPCRTCDAFTLSPRYWERLPAELLDRLALHHDLRRRATRYGVCEPCLAEKKRAEAAGDWPDYEIALTGGEWVNDNGVQRWKPSRNLKPSTNGRRR